MEPPKKQATTSVQAEGRPRLTNLILGLTHEVATLCEEVQAVPLGGQQCLPTGTVNRIHTSSKASDILTLSAPDSLTLSAPDSLTLSAPDTSTCSTPDTLTISAPDTSALSAPDTLTHSAPDSLTLKNLTL